MHHIHGVWAQICLDTCQHPSQKMCHHCEIAWKSSWTVALLATKLMDKGDAITAGMKADTFQSFICHLVCHSCVSSVHRWLNKNMWKKEHVQIHEIRFAGHFCLKLNAIKDQHYKCAWQSFSSGSGILNLITSDHWRCIHNSICELLQYASRVSICDPITQDSC